MKKSFELRKFELEECFGYRQNKLPMSALIIGSNKECTSLLVRDILCAYPNRESSNDMVISDRGCYNQFMPKENIKTHWKRTDVETFMHEQRQVLEKYQKQCQSQQQMNASPNVVLPVSFLVMDIIDDLWMRQRLNRYLIIHGCRFYISCILTMSYPMVVQPLLKLNLDVIFIFQEKLESNRVRLFELYGQMFITTYDTFCQVLDVATEEAGNCLVITTNTKSDKLEDNVFWYNATMG